VALAPALAYTAGLAAALTLGLGALGGFAALGAGFTFLTASSQGWLGAAQNLTRAQEQLARAQDAVTNASRPSKAQLDALKDAQEQLVAATEKANNPWTKLVTHFDRAADTLGKQAVPMVSQLLTFVDKLIDPVEKLGGSLLRWFG